MIWKEVRFVASMGLMGATMGGVIQTVAAVADMRVIGVIFGVIIGVLTISQGGKRYGRCSPNGNDYRNKLGDCGDDKPKGKMWDLGWAPSVRRPFRTLWENMGVYEREASRTKCVTATPQYGTDCPIAFQPE